MALSWNLDPAANFPQSSQWQQSTAPTPGVAFPTSNQVEGLKSGHRVIGRHGRVNLGDPYIGLSWTGKPPTSHENLPFSGKNWVVEWAQFQTYSYSQTRQWMGDCWSILATSNWRISGYIGMWNKWYGCGSNWIRQRYGQKLHLASSRFLLVIPSFCLGICVPKLGDSPWEILVYPVPDVTLTDHHLWLGVVEKRRIPYNYQNHNSKRDVPYHTIPCTFFWISAANSSPGTNIALWR